MFCPKQECPTDRLWVQRHSYQRPPTHLAVCACFFGMESAEKGLGVTLGELRMLKENLTGIPEALGLGEVRLGVWAAFTAT